jgi:hypothetical protein
LKSSKVTSVSLLTSVHWDFRHPDFSSRRSDDYYIVIQLAVDCGLKVLALRKSERGLEEVFKELTKG